MLQTFGRGAVGMRERIIEIAKTNGADIVGFAPADRFDKEDAIFKII